MDSIHLDGAEQVQRAGHEISGAAETMQRAAASIDESLRQHAVAMQEFVIAVDRQNEAKVHRESRVYLPTDVVRPGQPPPADGAVAGSWKSHAFTIALFVAGFLVILWTVGVFDAPS